MHFYCLLIALSNKKKTKGSEFTRIASPFWTVLYICTFDIFLQLSTFLFFTTILSTLFKFYNQGFFFFLTTTFWFINFILKTQYSFFLLFYLLGSYKYSIKAKPILSFKTRESCFLTLSIIVSLVIVREIFNFIKNKNKYPPFSLLLQPDYFRITLYLFYFRT